MKGLILQDLTPVKKTKRSQKQDPKHLVDGVMVTVKDVCDGTDGKIKSVTNFMSRHNCSLQEALARYDYRQLNQGNLSSPKGFKGYVL